MDYFKFDTHMHFDLFNNKNIHSKYLKISLGFHPE